MNKIVSKQEFKKKIRPQLKSENKTIALCHGVFDLVHPGHITHLKQASEIADVLVVSITASEYVRKGPQRPYFDDQTRMNFLAAIEYVDYVILSEGFTVDDIVEAVEPDFYVKGQEYSHPDDDVTGMIDKERRLVEAHGGKLYFTSGQVFSSTKLINTALSGLSDEVILFMQDFKKRHSIQEIRTLADDAKKLREYKQLCADKHIIKSEIEEKIGDFIYDYFEQPISFMVFLNLGGKYIIVENYSNQFFSDELIEDFCKHFEVDYEGYEKEIGVDYEGNEHLQQITYCFEVRWFR